MKRALLLFVLVIAAVSTPLRSQHQGSPPAEGSKPPPVEVTGVELRAMQDAVALLLTRTAGTLPAGTVLPTRPTVTPFSEGVHCRHDAERGPLVSCFVSGWCSCDP